uniref:Uncharacterized protein n=1 Tax=Arundo donax TaxID=35708 RepID=A0A0A9ASN8_ARUDO
MNMCKRNRKTTPAQTPVFMPKPKGLQSPKAHPVHSLLFTASRRPSLRATASLTR